jgi:hypothetical protein
MPEPKSLFSMQTCLGVTPNTGTAQTNVRKNRGTRNLLDFGTWAYARVDGQYTGTTDMIFRWAACKWGVDEDVVRSQATNEHRSWDQMNSGGDKHTIESQCVNGDFTSLWNYECSDCCFDSWSDFETKVY